MSKKYFSEDIITEIRSRADIVSLISEYVNLRKAGRSYVGLCPFHQEKTPSFSCLLYTSTEELRKEALDELLPMQENDFYGILKAMRGFPVTIRLLDPPLHEFLPNVEDLVKSLAEMKASRAPASEVSRVEDLLRKARGLQAVSYTHLDVYKRQVTLTVFSTAK